MTNRGNWPFLDRLTNDEFFDLLPHLSLENSFLTQIFLPTKNWKHMLEADFESLKVYCGCCEEQFRFDTIINHLTQKNHLKSLRFNVKQFYQPFYTFGKGDIKLARGEHISKDRREIALRELNTQMKSFKKDFILAKQFSDIVQSETQKLEEERLLQLSLKLKVENPEQMFVMVCLPFNDITRIHFCNAVDRWKPVFSYKYLTKNSKLTCNICDLNCSGIGGLNSHLTGFSHKLRQLELSTLQYEGNSQFNKNCSFYFGDRFTYAVKKDAKKFFGEGSNCIQFPKLSKEITRKVDALSEYVSKIFTNSIVNTVNTFIDQSTKLECEYLGHLGVEYVLRILKNDNNPDMKYECALCEFLGEENKMQRHILNYDHKKKYLDLHYSDTIKKYESLLGHMRYMKFRAVISEIVDKLAVEVEKHHSRSLPYTVSLHDYKIRRPEIIAEVYALLHASQNRGPSFSNVLSKEDLQNLKNSSVAENKPYKAIEYIVFTTPPKEKVYLNQISHDPVVRLREYNAKMSKNRTARSGRSITPTKSNYNLHDRIYTGSQDRRSRSRSPFNLKPISPLKRNIWDIYRREIATLANEIERDYEDYRKNPESHPLYEEEWNNFWQHRKRELELEGINHRTYNFQPEWVHYFKQRIEKLFGEALQESQLNVRRKLEIPFDAVEDSQRSHHLNEEPDKNIEESNKFRSSKRLRFFDYKEGRSNETPLNDEICGNKVSTFTTNKVVIKDNHSNVVHVLRLMTALEEHLGSLGGKIMDLLSNALQVEKHFQGNNFEFEANILTTTNCQLLETAVEKLKGILFAGLLDDNKISSFNHVIQYTTNLLKYAEKKGWRQDTAPLLSSYHGLGNKKCLQGQINSTQMSNEKPLSDTLMDLIKVPQTNKGSIHVAKELFSIPEGCPPPPDIKCSFLNPGLFDLYKGQSSKSGLASFDTKLSLDTSNHMQRKGIGQVSQTDIERLNRNPNAGVNILNNKSFKNNNETRTNAKTRANTVCKIGGSLSNSNGSSLQFRNSQSIPNLLKNNAMCQGGGGGNRNQNCSIWNNQN